VKTKNDKTTILYVPDSVISLKSFEVQQLIKNIIFPLFMSNFGSTLKLQLVYFLTDIYFCFMICFLVHYKGQLQSSSKSFFLP